MKSFSFLYRLRKLNPSVQVRYNAYYKHIRALIFCWFACAKLATIAILVRSYLFIRALLPCHSPSPAQPKAAHSNPRHDRLAAHKAMKTISPWTSRYFLQISQTLSTICRGHPSHLES
ncbi:hypothetical protein PoB_001220100 [Plakobranchus ocellatus]|uniref:Uncharacterized protein n=1 Tax=Plakobranchus ocellatus TaxID=259542 RepID=A0AAV3YQV3_9GAST|nr:hypothetical protein PoB_001220100 [Plakobranchus ocellatus]